MKKSDMTFSVYQLEVLKEFYDSQLPRYKFAQKKGISRSTFMRWVRIFEHLNPEMVECMKKDKSSKGSDDSAALTALRLENERLRTELKHEKMRAHAYDTMIDVAEEMFNIPIRKKAGTKQ
ncbi:MAG: hypothetical protein LKI39_03925 [Bacteroides sp.]|jgi:hypothetical protein|nr:hypothetical protein [Bacteroides sp.]